MSAILLIEDEPAIADNVVYALETEGMQVTWCATGGAGEAAFAAGAFDLVVMDVGLPDGSGFELFKRLRALRDVPTLFLTARGEEVDRVVGLELGADDYVVKPFSPRELAARIRAVLRRSSSRMPAVKPQPVAEAMTAEDPVVAVAGFAVDELRKRISYREVPLDLTAYQYRILRALLARPGWVLSRSQLMDAAWDEPDASLERTVDSHIKAIRAKLREIDAAANPIVTHRGHGYALEG